MTSWLNRLAGTTTAVLLACGGATKLGDESGAGRFGNGPRGEVTSHIHVGVLPVEDTPVAQLPSHEGHEPLFASPAQETSGLSSASPGSGRVLHVSTSGNDGGPGTEAAPFRTIGRAVQAAAAGDLIRVHGGTYAEKVVLNGAAGTAEQKIILQGEGRPKIIPANGGSGGMVQFQRPHWVVDGFDIDVQGQAQFAVTFSGSTTGSVLANCEIHRGSLGGGVTTFGGANGVTIQNNHIHHFQRGSADSHGVVIQYGSRDVHIRNNDIHSNSGDSVQCLGPEGFSKEEPASNVTIENNHFYSNRENGVDIKTCHNVRVRQNRMHGFRRVSSAGGEAVVVHMSARNVVVENNELYNAGKGVAVGGNRSGPMPAGVVVQRNYIHDILSEGGMDGSGVRLENSDGARVLHNTFRRISGYALVLGHGTGGPTQNAAVQNNLVDSAAAAKVATLVPGLKMGPNLYAPGAKFAFGPSSSQVEGNLDAWKGQGHDAPSFEAAAGLSDGSAPMPGSAAQNRGEDVGAETCGGGADLGAFETDC